LMCDLEAEVELKEPLQVEAQMHTGPL